jgi:hypothetical protein
MVLILQHILIIEPVNSFHLIQKSYQSDYLLSLTLSSFLLTKAYNFIHYFVESKLLLILKSMYIYLMVIKLKISI